MELTNAYALLIGVGGDDIPETVDDAIAIGDILSDAQKAAYPKENVVVLTEHDATRSRILHELRALSSLVNEVNDSTVVVYFSGHGVLYGSDYYLVPHGFDMSNAANTMIEGDEFSDLVNAIPAKRLLVVLDCCHASGMMEQEQERDGPKLKDLERTPMIPSNVTLLRKLRSGEGRVFLASCDDSERSMIAPDAKNSLFTEIAIQALEGYASKGEPYVSMIAFLYYVLTKVPQEALEHDHIQRPIINEINFLSPDYYICRSSLEKAIKNNDDVITVGQVQAVMQKHSIENLVTKKSAPHYLHQFPRGPMVEGYMIDERIIESYAKLIDQQQSSVYINQANRLRKQADPADDGVTMIQHIDLPSPKESNALNYWTQAFHLACLNGPRMLAALLNVLPDTQFDADTRTSRQQLLEYLKNHK